MSIYRKLRREPPILSHGKPFTEGNVMKDLAKLAALCYKFVYNCILRYSAHYFRYTQARASLESFTPIPSAPHFSSHGVSSLCLSTLMLTIDT